MPACCSCNSKGKCRKCSCVKVGISCLNCAPYRYGNCVNIQDSSTSQTSISDDSEAPSDSSFQLMPDPPSFSVTLPSYRPMSSATFRWGSVDGGTFIDDVNRAYEEVTEWKNNCFKLPQGMQGKHFVSELARLFEAFATRSPLESIALKAAIVMPILVLQKPRRNSKSREHCDCLERRMALWLGGDLNELVKEGRVIQDRLTRQHARNKSQISEFNQNISKSFTKLMFEGKTGAAISLLSEYGRSSLLHPSDVTDNGRSIYDILKDKHPAAAPLNEDSIIRGSPPDSHPVIFDSIDAALVRSVSLHTSGAAGPSGVDAWAWRKLCTSYKKASLNLCHSLALTAKRIAVEFVDPAGISSLLCCRLIALDKCPGVRPIGIGEVPRRIIAKAILSVVRDDIQEAVGSSQLCAGQIAGVEAAAHAIRDAYKDVETEAVLLVDASNAFNCLNRLVALNNIQFICPPLATVIINTYRNSSELFIGGKLLFSEEGTTQGDPLAMPFYALSTVPLINKLPSAKNVWYADDAAAVGKINDIRKWWNDIVTYGSGFGYFVNASKTWLVVKEEHYSSAVSVFYGTGVNITYEGRPHLGAPIGSKSYVDKFIIEKIAVWKSELVTLSSIAQCQPHAAYAAYIHGFRHKWSFISRTTPDISELFAPLEETIRSMFIPSLTRKPPPSDDLRSLFSIPARAGGLGISNPTKMADLEYSSSRKVCDPLICLILGKRMNFDTPYSVIAYEQILLKRDLVQERKTWYSERVTEIRETLSEDLCRSMDLASERGSSAWLTCLPIKEYGFCLHKRAFSDALALRYGWMPKDVPLHCACGQSFNVSHALSCPRGAYPSIRHNEVRDLTAHLLTEVCHDVKIEPELQPIPEGVSFPASTITTEGARLDIAMNGFWGGRFEKSFIDVRIFNPHAPSNKKESISASYLKHEKNKKRSYENRVREIEFATFTPIVMSATGGMAKQATIFYKRLASLLDIKRDEQSYSQMLNWLRCRLSFSLLHSAIQCIRGARSSFHLPDHTVPMDLITTNSYI